MIVIKNIKNTEFQLLVDGVAVRKGEYNINLPYRTSNKKKNLYLTIYSKEYSRKIIGYCFSDLPADLATLELHPNIPLLNLVDTHSEIQISKLGKGSGQFKLELVFHIMVAGWKHLWSITEYIEELRRISKSDPDSEIKLIETPGDISFLQPIRFQLPVITNTSLTIEAVINKYSNALKQLHVVTESSLKARLQNPNVEQIIRSIEFPPEYYHSGITVLSYFTDVLRNKNLSEQVKVSIEQSGLKVRLVIESPSGQRELIERTLESYALVVTGKQPIEALTQDPYEIMELKNQLRIANVQIENQRDMLALRQAEVTGLRSEIEDTKTSLKRLEQRSSEDSARFMSMFDTLVQHNSNLSSAFRELAQQALEVQNRKLAEALESLRKMIERGVQEEDQEEAIKNLRIIQKENPGVFRRVYDVLVLGGMSEVAGQHMYNWLQFIVGSLPK